MHSVCSDSRTENVGNCGVLHILDAEQQGACCSFEDFSWNCCMFFKMLTIEKELSIADIRGDSYVNIAVYSRYGVYASISVTLQQCREYLSQNLLVSKDLESFASGKFPPPHPSIIWACVVFEVLLCNYFSVLHAERVWEKNILVSEHSSFSGHASGVSNRVF